MVSEREQLESTIRFYNYKIQHINKSKCYNDGSRDSELSECTLTIKECQDKLQQLPDVPISVIIAKPIQSTNQLSLF